MSKAENLEILRQTVSRYGQPAEMANFLSHIMAAESGGDSRAANPKSSAKGSFQFINSTWDQYGRGESVWNHAAQCDAVVRFTMDNAKVLKTVLGHEPNAGQYYLAHFAGSGGAKKVLTAPPSTSIRSLLGDQVIEQNSSIKFKGKSFADFTAGDLQEWAGARMGVDIDAREAYAQRRKNGKTTTQEDAEELAIRRQNLEAFGFDKGMMEKLGLGGILGDLFIAIIKFFMNETAPAAERAGQENAPLQTARAPQVHKSQVATVANAPQKVRA